MTKRFKLELDGIEVTDPQNWKDFIPTRERHKVYKTVMSSFSSKSLILIKDAKNYVDAKFDSLGVLAKVSVELFRYNQTNQVYDSYLTGILDFNRYASRTNKTEIGLQPSSFELNLFNRDEIKLDLQKLVDMNGSPITPFTNETINLNLDGQIIDLLLDAKQEHDTDTLLDINPSDTNKYIWLDWPDEVQSEIETKNSISTIASSEKPNPLVNFRYSGITDIRSEVWIRYNLDDMSSTDFDIKLQINNDTPITGLKNLMYDTNLPSPNHFKIYRLTINETNVQINKGDFIRIYLEFDIAAQSQINIYYHGTFIPAIGDNAENEIYIFQNSKADDTTCKGILAWEYFLRLAQKITGRNDALRSSLLGRTDSPIKTYGSDGDMSLTFVTNGFNVRQFPLAQSHIIGAMKDAFLQFNAIEPIGLGIVYESGNPYISIEKVSDFFDTSAVLVTLKAEGNGIVWQPATDYLYGEIKAGYKTFENEENGILGTPHSPRVYTTELDGVVNKTYDVSSTAIASGHLIEGLRRDSYQDGTTKDSKHDKKIILIDVKRSGGSYVRVKDEHFSNVNNIENEETQYNLRLTPARNIQKHARWILAGLAKRVSSTPANDSYLRFQSGEANIELETQLIGDDLISESEDLTITDLPSDRNEPLFDAEIGAFKTDISNETVNLIETSFDRNIEVVDNGTTYKGFIESFKEKDLETATAEIKILRKYE